MVTRTAVIYLPTVNDTFCFYTNQLSIYSDPSFQLHNGGANGCKGVPPPPTLVGLLFVTMAKF